MSNIAIVGEINTVISKGFSLEDELFIPAITHMSKHSVDLYNNGYTPDPLLQSYHYDYETNLWRLNIAAQYPKTDNLTYLGYRGINSNGEALTKFLPYFDGTLHKKLNNNIDINDVYPLCFHCSKECKSPALFYVTSANKLKIIEAACLDKYFSKPSNVIRWHYDANRIYDPRFMESIKTRKKIPTNIIIASMLHAEKTGTADINTEQGRLRLERIISRYGAKSFRMFDESLEEQMLPTVILQSWVLNDMPQTTEGLKMLARLVNKPELSAHSLEALIEIPALYKKYSLSEYDPTPLKTKFDNLNSNFQS